MHDTRRGFLRLTAFGLTVGLPSLGGAQPPRILRDDTKDPAVGSRSPSPDLARLIGSLAPGEVARRGPLTVLWLGGQTVGTELPIETLDEARAAGVLEINERERASVPEVVVDNRGKSHVVMLTGEILLGGKQEVG